MNLGRNRARRISADAPNSGTQGGAPQSVPVAAIISAGSQGEAPNSGSQGGAPQSVPAAIDNQNNTDPHNEQSEEVQRLKIPRVSFESDDSGDEFGKDARNRFRLHPVGKTFDVNEERVNKVITHIIHSHYNGPWVSFSRVPGGPNGMKELWWKQFQNQFWWKDRHATRIKAIWRSKCSQHLRNTFWDARKEKIKPPFVSPEDWEIMKRYWETDDKFKHISEAIKKSRATEGHNGFPNYTGGSKSVVEIVKEIEKESGTRMTQEELVKAMYHSKKTGKYTDNRAEKSLDDFTQLCEKWIESHPGEEIPHEEINKLWLQAIGGEGKDRIYGQGSLYRKTDNVLNQAALQAPSPIGMSSTPSPQLLVGQQPPLPPSPPLRPVAPPQSIGGLQPPLPPSPLPYHPSPAPYRPLPPPYHPSPPPYAPFLPPPPPFLAQSASSSSHESEAQRQLEYYKIANQQQQDFVQQLLMQVNQGGMQRTNTSRFIPSTMQSNMSFQGLLNSAGPEVNGDAPRDPSTTSSLPRFYEDE